MLGLSAAGALARLDDERIPNQIAIALSPTVGWWMLVAAVAAYLIFIVQSDRWRRFWLVNEDPRSLALFRIVFTFFTIANVQGLREHFRFLFTDEGIFTADVARQVHAAAQFEGFGDGFGPDDPWGFFDLEAFGLFLWGPKWSLLYFWDSPTFFYGHLAAFYLSAFFLMIGLWSRTNAVLTFLLMNSLFFRNHAFWEGTDLVYRCFGFYLLLSRCGHAYSVDNWLRCRRLRKQGLLSERGGPGNGAGVAPSLEHPKGLQAIYRLVPAWPRRLMMLQLVCIYCYTGVVKNGSVWSRGDALYYALNMDHFYRYYPQQLSAIFGTNLFRVMTWVTHWWEVFFPVVLIGVATRWLVKERIPPLTGWRRGALWVLFLTLWGAAGAVVWITWPVHFTPFAREYFAIGWPLVFALLAGLWWVMGHRPPTVRRIGKLVLPEPVVLDRQWASRWLFGRRLWLGLSLVFHGHLVSMMNIGHFQTGMMAAVLPWLTGFEAAMALHLVGQAVGTRTGALGRWLVPEPVRAGLAPLPAEDPTLPHHHRDTAELPLWSLLAGLGFAVGGIVVAAVVQPEWNWLRIWMVGWLFLAGVAFQQARQARGAKLPPIDPVSGQLNRPWSYGPIGRLIAGTYVVWHITAVATWVLPDKDSLKAFRGKGHEVFAFYLTRTQTDQGWGMFAPNPPRANVFLKTLVTDQDGEVWDMKTDVYAPERKPIPWIWNDRMRKINRRVIGGESGGGNWYRKWYARYYCRQWAIDHGGVYPKRVDLVKVWYNIPSPEQVRDLGWYVPEQQLRDFGHEKVEHTEWCERTAMGTLPNEVRQRYGLPDDPPEMYKRWEKNKLRRWEQRKKTRAEAAEKAASGEPATPAAGIRAVPAVPTEKAAAPASAQPAKAPASAAAPQ
jgi:hypothetical protein